MAVDGEASAYGDARDDDATMGDPGAGLVPAEEGETLAEVDARPPREAEEAPSREHLFLRVLLETGGDIRAALRHIQDPATRARRGSDDDGEEEEEDEDEDEGRGDDDDDDDDDAVVNDFDPALTAAHAYLGAVDDARVSGGRHELARRVEEAIARGDDAAVTIAIPILALDCIVLFPGDTLPVTIHRGARHSRARRLLRECVRAPPPLTGLFGILHLHRGRRRYGGATAIDRVGTIAETRQLVADGGGGGDGDGGDDETQTVRLVARGRMRFRVKDPESFRETLVDAIGTHSAVVACGRVEVELMRERGGDAISRGGPPRGAFDVAGRSMTGTSRAVYDMFDARALTRRLHASPYLRLTLGDAEKLPRDPTALSYWVASRVPFASAAIRSDLLASDSVVARLRDELELLRRSEVEDTVIACATCGVVVSKLTELVVM